MQVVSAQGDAVCGEPGGGLLELPCGCGEPPLNCCDPIHFGTDFWCGYEPHCQNPGDPGDPEDPPEPPPCCSQAACFCNSLVFGFAAVTVKIYTRCTASGGGCFNPPTDFNLTTTGPSGGFNGPCSQPSALHFDDMVQSLDRSGCLDTSARNGRARLTIQPSVTALGVRMSVNVNWGTAAGSPSAGNSIFMGVLDAGCTGGILSISGVQTQPSGTGACSGQLMAEVDGFAQLLANCGPCQQSATLAPESTLEEPQL